MRLNFFPSEHVLDIVPVEHEHEVRMSNEATQFNHFTIVLVQTPHCCVQPLDGEVTYQRERQSSQGLEVSNLNCVVYVNVSSSGLSIQFKAL